MQFYSNGECIDFKNKNEVTNRLFEFIDNNKIEPLNKFTLDEMVNEYINIYKKQIKCKIP